MWCVLRLYALRHGKKGPPTRLTPGKKEEVIANGNRQKVTKIIRMTLSEIRGRTLEGDECVWGDSESVEEIYRGSIY